MKLHPRLTRATLELVTRFEAFQPQAQPAAAGGWTVGYGHTRSARQDARVGRADAEALLMYDLHAAAVAVEAALFAPVTQRQFEALTAFCFNIGVDNFRRSTALARINAGAELEAADEIERWRHAELGAGAQVVDALVRRRAAEKAHFLGLPEGFSKSPSALVRPLADGGEVEAAEPPPLVLSAPETPPAASATLDAANGIQARLRALIPDGDAVAAAPPPAAPPGLTGAAAAPEPSATAPSPPELSSPEPSSPEPSPLRAESSPAEHRVTAPLPPEAAPALAPAGLDGLRPAPPPANDSSPLVGEIEPPPAPPRTVLEPAVDAPPAIPQPRQTPPEVAPQVAAGGAAEDQVEPAAGERARLRRPSARTLQLLLITLGACLFIAAVVLILGGRPTLANLGLGVIGAVAMAPGVYGLLGPRPG